LIEIMPSVSVYAYLKCQGGAKLVPMLYMNELSFPKEQAV